MNTVFYIIEGKSSPSMRILINRICIAFNGLLSPSIVLSVISVSAAAAVLSWNERKFCMLWNIDFPDDIDQKEKTAEKPATHPPQ